MTAGEPCLHDVQDLLGRRQELPRARCVAEVVRPFAKEPDASAAHVQARAHAVALLGGGTHRHLMLEWQLPDPRKGVRHDCALELELARVRYMRQNVPSAGGIGAWFAPVG